MVKINNNLIELITTTTLEIKPNLGDNNYNFIGIK